MTILFAIALFPAFIVVCLAAFILYGTVMLALPHVFKSLLRAAVLYGTYRLICTDRSTRA